MDFVVYGPKGFLAVEVKRGKGVHALDLKSLLSFVKEYPEGKPVFLYLAKEKRKVAGVDCIPVPDFLPGLHPNKQEIFA